jgi:hypothetical protein
MMIILPTLPDPTDLVIQGEQIAPPVARSTLTPVLQGELMVCACLVPGSCALCANVVRTVPQQMIKPYDLYGALTQVGPMRVGGGEIVMQPIGMLPVNPVIDPTQRFLLSSIVLDPTGAMLSLEADLLGALEPVKQIVQGNDRWVASIPSVPIPRTEIVQSGNAKLLTAPTPKVDWGIQMFDSYFVESSMRWSLSGVTRNSAGAALGNCTVVVINAESAWLDLPDRIPDRILVVGETISDGGGNYTILCPKNSPYYQAMAYLPGVPDVAGITARTLMPVAAG